MNNTENEKEIIIDAELKSIYQAIEFMNNKLNDKDVPIDISQKIEFALEEMLVNIVNYAYPEGDGKARVEVSFPEEHLVRLDVWDNGIPYDPTKKPDPDVTIPLKQRKIGGLGIYMTKMVMDEMRYEYVDGANHTILIKDLRQKKPEEIFDTENG